MFLLVLVGDHGNEQENILWFNGDMFVYQCDTCSIVLASSMST